MTTMNATPTSLTVTKPTIRNGVNVTQLTDTMAAIRDNRKIAEFVFRARNVWMDGGHNKTFIRNFYGACQEDTSRKMPFVFDNDEPACLLGHDRGANPVEFVLHALAGCLTTSLVYHASAKGYTIESVETRLEGDLDLHGFLAMDESVRNGYTNIRVAMTVKGDAPEEVLQELVQVAQQRSPVYDVVRNGLPIDVTYER